MAPSAPVLLRRDPRLVTVSRALTRYAVAIKELPGQQCATPPRLRFPEDWPGTTRQTSHNEQPALCVRQPPNDQLVERQPTNGMETKVGLVGSPATGPADAGTVPI